jgi:hypothetical protein
MLVLLLITNFIAALPLAVPVFWLISRSSAGTLQAQRLFRDNLDPIWFSDVVNERIRGAELSSTATDLIALLAVMGGMYLLVSTLTSGGILEVYNSEDGRFTMRKFWSGCGAYFWRFFRLMCVSLIFYGAAVGLWALATWRINVADERATVERPGVLWSYGAALLLLLLAAVINMVVDYAKIGAVVNDRSKMFREAFKAARFALGHFFTTGSLYLAVAIVGLVLFVCLTLLRGAVQQSSYVGVFLAFVIGQTAIASRVWTRLAFYSAQLDLYKSLVPAPRSADTTQPPTDTAANAELGEG